MPSRFRAVLLATIGVQLLCCVTLAFRGFPYFGSDLVSNAALWEAPVALFHLPGLVALSLTGYCCGFHNALVLGPRIVGGHIRMSAQGILILALTNTALLLVPIGLGWGLWRLRSPKAGVSEAPVSKSGVAERP
jgi:hypothetical protein